MYLTKPVSNDDKIPILEIGVRLSDVLIDENMAVRYHGQSKDDIAEQHIKNREVLIGRGLV